jgi:hypothetical protein
MHHANSDASYICFDYTLTEWSVSLAFLPSEGSYYGGATEFAGMPQSERATKQETQPINSPTRI